MPRLAEKGGKGTENGEILRYLVLAFLFAKILFFALTLHSFSNIMSVLSKTTPDTTPSKYPSISYHFYIDSHPSSPPDVFSTSHFELLRLSAAHLPYNLTHDLAMRLTLKILDGTAHVSHLAQAPLGSRAQNAGRQLSVRNSPQRPVRRSQFPLAASLTPLTRRLEKSILMVESDTVFCL